MLAGALLPASAQQSSTPGGPPAGGHQHASASSRSAGAPNLKAEGSYSLGVLMGAQMHQFGLNANSIAFDKVLQGLKDVTSGKAQPSPQDQQNLRALIMHARTAAAESNAAAARKFLAENGRRPGVKTTPSGLQYKVLSEGSGAPPHPTDQVVVNYRGTLLDGSEFDSSYRRGRPATFTVNQVIPGWREALGLMKPGSKFQLFIPPELAYGNNAPPSIPPGSLLEFEVELLKVGATPASPGTALPNAGPGAGR